MPNTETSCVPCSFPNIDEALAAVAGHYPTTLTLMVGGSLVPHVYPVKDTLEVLNVLSAYDVGDASDGVKIILNLPKKN